MLRIILEKCVVEAEQRITIDQVISEMSSLEYGSMFECECDKNHNQHHNNVNE